MGSVDDRIVAMKFDNNDFESKISRTLDSLKRLKERLTFHDENKNLQELSKTGKNFSLDGIGSAVENISGKFSALGAIGFTTLQNLTNQALTFGPQIAKSLSFGSIKAGISEYETGLTSIQTIAANTDGKSTMPQIEEALQKLNEYSDQTIYNFGQMARNIGTFTAAGVNLDASVGAIKGIANLAALSGSNSEQASAAMYQLSQAMSSGSVKAQDWISVVNAGIGGAVFKSSLFDAAKALGTITDSPVGQTFEEWTAAGGNFKDIMSEGVITADVLSQALSTFTGDLSAADLATKGYTQTQIEQIMRQAVVAKEAATQVKTFTALISTVKEQIGSGWAVSAKLFIGNIEEAKATFSSINYIISTFVERVTNARNELLRGWRELKGRESLIQSLRNILWAVATAIWSVQKAFREIFPKKTAAELARLTYRFESFTKKLIPTEETLSKVTRIFKGIFSVFSIGISVVKAIFSVFRVFFDVFNSFSGGGFILEFFAKIADKVTLLKETLDEGGGVKTFVDKWIVPIGEFIKKIDFASKLDAVIKKFNEFKNVVTTEFGKIDFESKFKPLIEGFNRLKDAIGGFFSNGFSSSSDVMGSATERIGNRFESFLKIGEKFGQFFDWVSEKVEGAAIIFKTMFDRVAEAIKGGNYDNIRDALNVGLFSFVALMFGKFLHNGLSNFDVGGGLFKQLKGSFRELTGVLKSMQTDIKADALTRIAKALALLTASILVLSLIDSAALTKALFAVGLGFAALMQTMKSLEKTTNNFKDTGEIVALSASLIALSVAIGILAVSVFILSKISQKDLDKGLTSITLLLIGLSLSIKAMGDPKEMGKTGAGILGLAVALGLLVGIVVLLAKIDVDILTKGMLALGILLTEITLSIRSIPDDTGVKALDVLGFAAALVILTKVVKIFGEMDPKDTLRGLAGLGLMLTLVVTALRNMPKEMGKMALELIGISISLLIITQAIKQLAEVDPYAMLAAVVALSVVLAAMVLSINLLKEGSGEGIAALLLAAVAILAISAAFQVFAGIGIGGVIVGLIAIVSTFLIVALLSTVLASAVPAILAFGGALLVVGQGMALIGLSILLFGAGVAILVFSIYKLVSIGKEGVDTFLEILPKLTIGITNALLTALLNFAIGLVPVVIAFGNLALVALSMIRLLIPKVQEVFNNIIEAIIQTITDNSQRVIDTGWTVLLQFMQGIRDNIYEITILVGDIVILFLSALSKKIPDIIKAATDLLVSFLDGITSNLDRVVESVGKLIAQFIESLGKPERVNAITEAGGKLLANLIRGIGDAIVKDVGPAVLDFVRKIATELLTRQNIDALISAGYSAAINILNGLADAIDRNSEEMGRAVGRLAGSIIKGIVKGLRAGGDEVVNAFKELASEMLRALMRQFGIASPSKVTTEMAGQLAAGFVVGFKKDTSAQNSADLFGANMVSSINGALTQVALGVENMGEFNPTIAPVIDMTNIEKGASRMSKLMGDPTLTPNVSFDQAASLALATSSAQQDLFTQEQSTPSVTELNFTQTIHSPKPISTADIYRQTKSQIAHAKEELLS